METIFITEKDFLKARRKINENKNKGIIFSSDDDELNRKILEKEKVDVFMPLLVSRKDFQKQRNSGFNQVLAKIAKKNNITLGVSLDEIINSRGKRKAEILARIAQNIKLCSKNKIKMIFLGKEKRNVYDLKALGLILGMPTWMTKSL